MERLTITSKFIREFAGVVNEVERLLLASDGYFVVIFRSLEPVFCVKYSLLGPSVLGLSRD